jgi:hypothetical protein
VRNTRPDPAPAAELSSDWLLIRAAATLRVGSEPAQAGSDAEAVET